MDDVRDGIHKEDDKTIFTSTYDNSAVLEHNLRARNDAPETGRYKASKSGLVNIGKIHMGDIARLSNMGYKLLSSDRDEVKRALLYIQENEPYLLTVPGKPIAKKKLIWE